MQSYLALISDCWSCTDWRFLVVVGLNKMQIEGNSDFSTPVLEVFEWIFIYFIWEIC